MSGSDPLRLSAAPQPGCAVQSPETETGSDPAVHSFSEEPMPTATTIRPSILRALAVAGLGLLLATSASAAVDAKGSEFFTDKVWPIIDGSCTSCHGVKKQKAKRSEEH